MNHRRHRCRVAGPRLDRIFEESDPRWALHQSFDEPGSFRGNPHHRINHGLRTVSRMTGVSAVASAPEMFVTRGLRLAIPTAPSLDVRRFQNRRIIWTG